jgi:chemotaxis protein histidine kinase CheA
MKKSPLILTMLCTNLILSSSQNAMEEQVVLDRRSAPDDGRPQILVLTEAGRRKAEFLQESYDQEKERRYDPFHSEGLGEDPELKEAIRLSLEQQTLSLKNLTSSTSSEDPELAEGIRLSLLENQTTPTVLSTLSSVNEEEDPLFQKALTASAQDYEYQQKKLAEKKEALEKERLQKKRDEVRKVLEEETDLRRAQKQSLFSKINELRKEQQEIRNKFISSRHSQQSTEDFLKSIRLEDEEIKGIDSQVESLLHETESFKEMDNLIHEEVIRLIRGGDPMDLPWMQQLSFTQQGDTPLLSSSSGSLPSIPSSALPNLNFGSPDKK